MILGIKGLNVTLIINDTQFNNALHYSERCNAECRILFVVLLNDVMLNVIMLNVIMLNVIILSVVLLSVVMINVSMLSVVGPKI
jgi:hypothetical protein